uniref:Uncharacterized protein n=1 Tax=viral metagenome TaxID=1070528 RepID=A0A6M3IRU7_9ZZZZ
MNLHLSKLEVLKLICDKYDIPYDELKDNSNCVIDMVLKYQGVIITWEGTTYDCSKIQEVEKK